MYMVKKPQMKRRRVVPRRRFRNGKRIPRIKRPLALSVHNFVERHTIQDTIQIDTETSAIGLFKTFTLDQCNNVGNYKDLFEYYKINKVVVTFKYKGEGEAASWSTTAGQYPVNEHNPLLYFKVDHNDVTADPIIGMQQSMRTRTKVLTNNNSEFSITLKPAVQSEAYKTALATTYIPKWNQWLSTNDGSVPHYGLKVYAIGYRGTTYNPGKIQVEYKTYFSCKNNE